ncbi:Uncharacterised protein [Campylobacter hyointestinalis subsp. hyointestinalis]|uniref:Uncharacterized protein n=1 Tax=Campylobacter hyointestinalis subsp. hyointestinalis TaxID=91352 RepID=A0A0S4RDA4_CAMHY|nr:hypothetical protein [Campylobacter hyointestinalis]CUU71189.1 Uncharacterised protein [Campylobacter hyointestinalis subsp. hyointestinalis]
MATKPKQEIDEVVSDTSEIEDTAPKVDSMVTEAKGVSTEALFKISNDSGKGTIKKKTITVIRN